MSDITKATVPGTQATIEIKREKVAGSGTWSVVYVTDPDLVHPLSQAYRNGNWSGGSFTTMTKARDEANRIYREITDVRTRSAR